MCGACMGTSRATEVTLCRLCREGGEASITACVGGEDEEEDDTSSKRLSILSRERIDLVKRCAEGE